MEKENKKLSNTVVQTYAEDMAEVLENDKEGLVKKIIHGEEEHEEEKKNLSPESKKNKVFMFVSILLIFLALAVLAFFFLKKDTNTVRVEKQFIPIIFNDQNSYLEISSLKKDEITQIVLNEVNTTNVKAGGIEGIYLTLNKQIVGLRNFIALIKANFIPGENTLFISDNFLMGVFNDEEISKSASGGGFFILLKVRSALDIFDPLRKWEGKMFSDLHKFFGIDLTSETGYLLTKNFEDGIVENKNARLLYNKEGQPVIMYVFADDNSVIITNSRTAVHEIVLRLVSSKTKQ